MNDELKYKVRALEKQLLSWSSDTDAEVQALCGQMSELEGHMNQQRSMLERKQEEIRELIQQNDDLKSILGDLLGTIEGLLQDGPDSWLSTLKVRCSTLLETASQAEAAVKGVIADDSEKAYNDAYNDQDENSLREIRSRVEKIFSDRQANWNA